MKLSIWMKIIYNYEYKYFFIQNINEYIDFGLFEHYKIFHISNLIHCEFKKKKEVRTKLLKTIVIRNLPRISRIENLGLNFTINSFELGFCCKP